jgi:nicotinamide-nucleotide amidase
VIDERLTERAAQAARLLRARGGKVGVAEGSCGGLVSAALLSVPGASDYYAGGTVIYTLAASRAFLAGPVAVPPGMRGASEAFASYLARSVAAKLEVDWGIGEGGAAGPSGNGYGDPAGHAWLAVSGPPAASTDRGEGDGPADRTVTRHLLTGSSDREANMVAFATAALELLVAALEASPDRG